MLNFPKRHAVPASLTPAARFQRICRTQWRGHVTKMCTKVTATCAAVWWATFKLKHVRACQSARCKPFRLTQFNRGLKCTNPRCELLIAIFCTKSFELHQPTLSNPCGNHRSLSAAQYKRATLCSTVIHKPPILAAPPKLFNDC